MVMEHWFERGREILEEFASYGEVDVDYSALAGEYVRQGFSVIAPFERAEAEQLRRTRLRGYDTPTHCQRCSSRLRDVTDSTGRRTKKKYCGNACKWADYNERMQRKEGTTWRKDRKKRSA